MHTLTHGVMLETDLSFKLINLFSFFIHLIQKYDWNILCLLNSSFSFFKY